MRVRGSMNLLVSLSKIRGSKNNNNNNRKKKLAKSVHSNDVDSHNILGTPVVGVVEVLELLQAWTEQSRDWRK